MASTKEEIAKFLKYLKSSVNQGEKMKDLIAKYEGRFLDLGGAFEEIEEKTGGKKIKDLGPAKTKD